MMINDKAIKEAVDEFVLAHEILKNLSEEINKSIADTNFSASISGTGVMVDDLDKEYPNAHLFCHLSSEEIVVEVRSPPYSYLAAPTTSYYYFKMSDPKMLDQIIDKIKRMVSN